MFYTHCIYYNILHPFFHFVQQKRKEMLLKVLDSFWQKWPLSFFASVYSAMVCHFSNFIETIMVHDILFLNPYIGFYAYLRWITIYHLCKEIVSFLFFSTPPINKIVKKIEILNYKSWLITNNLYLRLARSFFLYDLDTKRY